MSYSTKKTGNEGENIAVEYLKSVGYEIIHRNYRFGKGEIDIIAKDNFNSYLVFVEVKAKKNIEFGHPEFSITENKKKQLRKIASAYLYENNIESYDCRFDVVTILINNKTNYQINHYPNAF